MIITAASDVNPAVQEWYDRNMLERAVPKLIHGRFLSTKPMPKGNGTVATFTRMNSLPAATLPLADGVPSVGQKGSVTRVSITVKQYGDYIIYTDWLSMTSMSGTLAEFSSVLGDQAGLTKDTLDRDFLLGGTTIRYANSVAARANVVTAPSPGDMKAITRILEGGNAEKIAEMVKPGVNVSTQPVPAAYYALTNSNCRQDFEALVGFKPVENYASQKGVTDEEIGAYGPIRILVSSNGKCWPGGGAAVGASGLTSTGGNVDVYATIVLGANAAGGVTLSGESIKNIVKKLDSGGVENALNQRGSSGWTMVHGGGILNDELMLRFEHGILDL